MSIGNVIFSYKMEIYERIRKTREKRKLNQKELAELLKQNRVTITNIENGRNKGNFELLKEICEVLEVSADYLLFGVETEKKKLNEKGKMLLEEYEKYLLEKYPEE